MIEGKIYRSSVENVVCGRLCIREDEEKATGVKAQIYADMGGSAKSGNGCIEQIP